MGRFEGLTTQTNNEQPFVEEKSIGRFFSLVPQTQSINPEQARERAKIALGIAKDYKVPISNAQQFIAGPEPSFFGRQIDKIKSYINEKTGYFEPPIYGVREFREEHKLKTVAQFGARTVAETISGLSLTVTDVLANKITGDKTLAELVDRISGFEPTPGEVSAGTAAKYIGAFKTASTGIGAGVAKIPAAQALKTILASGLTFGSVESAMQFSKNITEGKPVDWNAIHFASGIGVLWGVGEVAVTAAVSGLAKGFEKYWGSREIELAKSGVIGKTLQEQKAIQAAEKLRDINRAKESIRSGKGVPQDLRDKYISPPTKAKPVTKTGDVTPGKSTQLSTKPPTMPQVEKGGVIVPTEAGNVKLYNNIRKDIDKFVSPSVYSKEAITNFLIQKYGSDPEIILYRGITPFKKPKPFESDTTAKIGKYWTPDYNYAKQYSESGAIYKVTIKASDLMWQSNSDFVSPKEIRLSGDLQKNAEQILPPQPLSQASEAAVKPIQGTRGGFVDIEPLQKVVDTAIDTTKETGLFGKSVVNIAKDNLSRVSGVMNRLGSEGKKLSAQISDTAESGTRGLDWRIQKVFNNSAIKMDEALKDLSVAETKLVTKLTNHRISPNSEGVTPKIIKHSELYRAVLDELQTEYTATGGMRKVKGKWLSMLPTGKGDAHPHVLSEEGQKAVEGAYSKGAKDARAFTAAREMVAEGRASSISDAIKKMVRFKKAQLEGLDPYFMSTRLDMPTEYIEWNARTFAHNFLWKKWTLIEAQRIWGANGFPKLEVSLKKIGNEFGSQIEDKLRTYLRVEFGLQESPGSPASKFITSKIRQYHAAIGTSTNAVNIIANAIEGAVKGYKIGGLSQLSKSFVKLPPLALDWKKSAKEMRKTLVKFGGIPDYMGIMPETNLGVKSGGIGTVRSLVEEASYRRIALVKLLSLERDVKLLRDIDPDRTRGLERYTALVQASLGGEERALSRLKKAGFNDVRIKELTKLSNEELANVFIDTAGRDAEVVGACLYRTVRDEMFPRTLATKNVWMNANSMAEWLKTLFQFKSWQVEQIKNIAQSAKKAVLPPKGEPRDIGQFIRFIIGLGIAGELQNIIRDWAFDSEKSVLYQVKSGDTNTGKIINAIKNDLVAGGFGPIIANVMYGMEDLLLGPAKSTVGKLVVLGGEAIRNPKLAPQSIAKFAKQAPVVRLASSLINKIDSQLNSQNVTSEYNKWRSRSGEWADKQKFVTIKDKATKIYERIFETIGYGKTDRTFPLQLASEQITKGDIIDASDYLRMILDDSKGEERKDLLTGIKVSMNSHSPMGFIPKENRKEFLKQLNAPDKKELISLQNKWIENYKTALSMAKAK